MRGQLFVLEGLDGCGKSTQLPLVSTALSQRGIPTRVISFPDYNDPSSAPVQLYLSGALGQAEAVGAYAASSFYAVDRYCAYRQHWGSDFEAGQNILSGRYVSSNAIYQMTKLPRTEWDSFLTWLADYEYVKLGLPRPTRTVFLDLPLETAQKLLSQRYQGDEQKKDVHECNLPFLQKCREAAIYAAEYAGWKIVSCVDEQGALYGIDAMTQRITDAFTAVE